MAEYQFSLDSTKGTPAGTLVWTIPVADMPVNPWEPTWRIDETVEHSFQGRLLKVLRYKKQLIPMSFRNISGTSQVSLRDFAQERKDIRLLVDVNNALGEGVGTYNVSMMGDFAPKEVTRSLWDIDVLFETIDSVESGGNDGTTIFLN